MEPGSIVASRCVQPYVRAIDDRLHSLALVELFLVRFVSNRLDFGCLQSGLSLACGPCLALVCVLLRVSGFRAPTRFRS